MRSFLVDGFEAWFNHECMVGSKSAEERVEGFFTREKNKIIACLVAEEAGFVD